MASNPPPGGANGPYTALPSNAASAGGGIMPSAGHFADMQTLMQNLDALSGWLQQNREDFEGLREGLRRVEGMNSRLIATEEIRQLSEENGAEPEDQVQILTRTVEQLNNDLSASSQRIASLESSLESYHTLHSLFHNTLTDTMRLIRNYTYSQQIYITELHRHYTKLLQESRYETLEAQLIHQKWQEGLAKVSETCRDAIKARDEEVDKNAWRAELKGLKLENRLLRRKVGWEVRPDSDEEGEEDAGEEAVGSHHVRTNRGGLGVRHAGESVVVV